MTFDDIREIGLKLPGTEETRYYRMPALKVNDGVFVVKTSHPSAEPNSVSVAVGYQKRKELIAAKPDTFYLKQHYEPYPVVVARLNRITHAELKDLLQAAHKGVSSGAIVPGRRRKSAGKKKR